MRIRQPLARSWRIGLGVVSIVSLILAYGALAHFRQEQKRELSREQLRRVQSQLADVEKRLAEEPRSPSAATDAQQRLHGEQTRLQMLSARLEADSKTAEDRTVPTWRSLYEDGLLRVLRPEGLKVKKYWLWEDAVASFQRLALGMVLGVLISIAVGLAMGCYAPIEAILLPPLAFIAKIPPTAMLAVFFVLVGTGLEMYISMIAFGTLPTLAQTIYQSARADVPDELIYKADTLGASQFELMWCVIFRQILPRLLDAVRLQVGPAMVLLVAAEWMVAGEGFGYRLRLFFQRTDMTVVYVYLIVLGAAGLIIDQGLIALRRWLCPWFGD